MARSLQSDTGRQTWQDPSAGQQTWPDLVKSNTGQQTLPDPSNEPQDNTTVCKTIARRSRSDSGHLLTWLGPLNRTQAWLDPFNQTQNRTANLARSRPIRHKTIKSFQSNTGQQTWQDPFSRTANLARSFANQTQDNKPCEIPPVNHRTAKQVAKPLLANLDRLFVQPG